MTPTAISCASSTTPRAAVVRVRRPSGALGTFDAHRVNVDGSFVTATGLWRDDRQRKQRSYTWQPRQIIEIRWQA